MAWRKQGCVFEPTGTLSSSMSHAQVPSALLLPDRLRVYYATRDASGRSRTTFVDLDRRSPERVLYRHDKSVMELGDPGTFDEDGVMVGCVLAEEGRILMYYTGWSRGGSVPYRVAVGLAESLDGGMTFRRVFEGPVVDRTRHEPHMTMSPYVIREAERLWSMWYGSGIRWAEIESAFEPIYVIKLARSVDGRMWSQPDTLCIPQAHDLEANTRPSVLRGPDGYEMWFSYRDSREFRDGNGAYRIGFARSADGAIWERESDPVGLGVGPDDWDSRMMAYPNVIDVDDRRVMFYNGNGFGRSGFGFAVWKGGVPPA